MTKNNETGIKGTKEVAKTVPGMINTAERTILKKAITTGYDTAMKAATIYETAIKEVYAAHAKDKEIKEPTDIKKLILAATRQILGIKNEKEDTENARKYRAFARFCNQSFNWKDNRKKTAIEFKEEKEKKPSEKKGEEKPKANKEKMTLAELKEAIRKGEPWFLDEILSLFKISYLVVYIEKKKAERAEKDKTVNVKAE